MSNKHNGDSSSSEDEISKDALKEAIDHQFLKNDYFSNEKFQNSDVFKKTDEHSKYYNLTFSFALHILLLVTETCNN